MKKVLKAIVCLALCLSLMLGSSIASFAASGSVYSYDNLNLTWSTSRSSSSATLRSGSNSYKHPNLFVSMEGYFYSDRRVVYKCAGNSSMGNTTVTCSVPLQTCNNSVTMADGLRGSQYISAYLYY